MLNQIFLFAALIAGIVATTCLTVSAYANNGATLAIGILALGVSNEIAIINLIIKG